MPLGLVLQDIWSAKYTDVSIQFSRVLKECIIIFPPISLKGQ